MQTLRRLALVGLALAGALSTSTAAAQAPGATPPSEGADAPAEGAAAPPSAIDEAARAVFVAGREAFASARYEESLRLFQQAYSLSPRPALLYNVGQAADRLRMDEVALEAFRGFLAAGMDGGHAEEVRVRVGVLERALASRSTSGTADPPASASSAPAGETAPVEAVTSTTATPIDEVVVASGAPEAPVDEGFHIEEEWWFWTVLGLVVVGGTLGTIAAVRSQDGLPTGDVGHVVYALGGTW